MVIKRATAFARQPSTVLGLSTLVGALTAVLTGEITWQGAVPAIAGALAAIMLPDNSGAQVAIRNAAAAVVVAEQAAVNPPARATIAVGVAKITPAMMFLSASSFCLSACAVQPAVQVRAVADLRVAYVAAHAAETAYSVLPGAVPAVTAEFAMLDEAAGAALASYDAAPTDDARARAAAVAVATLAAYGAARAIR